MVYLTVLCMQHLFSVLMVKFYLLWNLYICCVHTSLTFCTLWLIPFSYILYLMTDSKIEGKHTLKIQFLNFSFMQPLLYIHVIFHFSKAHIIMCLIWVSLFIYIYTFSVTVVQCSRKSTFYFSVWCINISPEWKWK